MNLTEKLDKLPEREYKHIEKVCNIFIRLYEDDFHGWIRVNYDGEIKTWNKFNTGK